MTRDNRRGHFILEFVRTPRPAFSPFLFFPLYVLRKKVHGKSHSPTIRLELSHSLQPAGSSLSNVQIQFPGGVHQSAITITSFYTPPKPFLTMLPLANVFMGHNISAWHVRFNSLGTKWNCCLAYWFSIRTPRLPGNGRPCRLKVLSHTNAYAAFPRMKSALEISLCRLLPK